MSILSEIAMMTPAQRDQLVADLSDERQRDIDRAIRDLEKRLRIRRMAAVTPAHIAAVKLATLVVHTPDGPQPCCDRHAAEVRGALFLLSAQVYTVPAAKGQRCTTCMREAATTVSA